MNECERASTGWVPASPKRKTSPSDPSRTTGTSRRTSPSPAARPSTDSHCQEPSRHALRQSFADDSGTAAPVRALQKSAAAFGPVVFRITAPSLTTINSRAVRPRPLASIKYIPGSLIASSSISRFRGARVSEPGSDSVQRLTTSASLTRTASSHSEGSVLAVG